MEAWDELWTQTSRVRSPLGVSMGRIQPIRRVLVVFLKGLALVRFHVVYMIRENGELRK